jgi:hypothetical protein
MPVVISGTNGVSGVDGTASNPSYEGTDSNTGIFFPAADTIAFAEGGTEVARFDSSGNLGIGTSSPNQRLQVNNPAAASSFALFTNATTGSTNADGSFYGVDSSGNAYVWNQENLPILFGTNNGERMRIDNAGNVGIGTSSPQKKLSVSNSGAAGVEIDPFTRSGTTGGALLAYNRSGAAFVRMDYDASEHIFFTSTSERARITSTGSFDLTQATTQGAYLRSQSFVTLASNATLTLTSTICGSVLVCVYQRGDGDGGVFFANFATATTLIAGQGSATDAGSTFAVYKSSSSHTLTLRNRYATSKTFAIAIYSADAQP